MNDDVIHVNAHIDNVPVYQTTDFMISTVTRRVDTFKKSAQLPGHLCQMVVMLKK